MGSHHGGRARQRLDFVCCERTKKLKAVHVRVLMVEDTQTDADLALRRLTMDGIDCALVRVETEEAFLAAIHERNCDLILSDFSLPQFNGLAALEIAAREAPQIPFIFVSGTLGEERAIDALRRGAADYVLKNNLKRLAPAIRRALQDAAQRLAREEQQLRIARLTRILEMLSGINTAVVRIRDRMELLREVCRISVGTGRYVTAVVSFLQADTLTARPTVWAGAHDPDIGNRVFHVAQTQAEDSSVTGRVLRSGELFFCNDIEKLHGATAAWLGFDEANFRSVAALPLTIDGTPVGVLLLTASDTDALTEEETRLLREVAANLSFALQYFEKESAVQFLSYFDPLTGLAKRALFCQRLAAELLTGAADGPQPAVAVLDIQHLSVINDSYGRHAGDHLLQKIADRLKDRLHSTDDLAYLGAGCFAMVLERTLSPDEALRELQQHIAASFGRPFQIDGRDLPVTIRSGLACRDPAEAADAEVLLQNAEAALRQAKAAGEQYHLHRLDLSSKLSARLAMEYRLRRALDNQQYCLYYQPKIHIPSGRVEGVEALLRWNDPERGLVSPADFLPILESTGMIIAVGEWALAQAARDCQRWKAAGLRPVRVAVNCSPLQLRRSGFAQQVLDALEGWDFDGWGIDVEITESLLIDPESPEVDKLRMLREAGVRVAIDDFGTGYSSLSRLAALPIDTLKIDRSFIMGLPEDRAAARLVPTIIALARAFDLITVAEGVETSEQLAFLARAGCDQSQGYLHARPLPATAMGALLLQAAHYADAAAERAVGELDIGRFGRKG
jgi:diguanylate cyclase (GGDEF)-like protein